MSQKTVIHVGLPKAASTLLQHHLLSSIPGYVWLGAVATGNIGRSNQDIPGNSAYLNDPQLRGLYERLIHGSQEHFLNQLQSTIALKQELTKKYVSDDACGAIFSSEFLTSTFFSHSNVLEKAERIHAVWPDATIVMVIREQYSMLVSQYLDQPFDPRNISEARALGFEKWLQYDESRGETSLQNSLDYLRLYKAYCDLFGRDKVRLLLFEDIVHDKARAAEQLRRLFELDIDTRVLVEKLSIIENTKPGALFQFLRKVKRVLLPGVRLGAGDRRRTLSRFLSSIGSPQKLPVNEGVRDKVTSRYQQTNRELDQLTALGSGKYGYFQ